MSLIEFYPNLPIRAAVVTAGKPHRQASSPSSQSSLYSNIGLNLLGSAGSMRSSINLYGSVKPMRGVPLADLFKCALNAVRFEVCSTKSVLQAVRSSAPATGSPNLGSSDSAPLLLTGDQQWKERSGW